MTNMEQHGALSTPVYRNVAFEFADSEAIAEAFRGESGRHTYSRISNPTVAAFEERVRGMTGAEAVVALSSGMAAITNTFFAIARAGDNVVTSPKLFGNTFSFFKGILTAFGVEIRFVDTDDPAVVEAAVDERTCAFFAELATNPHMEIADLEAISRILRPKKVPMIVDTTLIPWCGFRADDFGVDVEIVSTTKYVSGGATSTGGVIVDYGTADWSKNPRIGPESTLARKLRTEIVRNLGAAMTPDTAAMQTLGLETLQVRYERMSAAAERLARHFADRVQVNYPSLGAYGALSERYFTGSPGAMFTMSLASQEECFRFMDALRVWHRATNLFDNRSLVIHPSSTIYCTFTPEAKRTAGIEDTLIRFSVGLEEFETLKNDIENALKTI